MKKILWLAAALLLAGCSDGPGATETLTNAGYTNIKTYGWEPFACGRDDVYSTKFTAFASNGRPVSGAVCRGFLFKASTIRYF